MEKGERRVKKEKPKEIVVRFRVAQALCFGIFTLGLAMMAGDYSAYIQSPFSALSLSTTIFGLLGSMITGMMAKQAEKW